MHLPRFCITLNRRSLPCAEPWRTVMEPIGNGEFLFRLQDWSGHGQA